MRKNKVLAHYDELLRKYSWQYCCNDRFRPLFIYLSIYFTEPLQSHLGEAVKFCKTVIFNSGI